jgi:antitoxin YefM
MTTISVTTSRANLYQLIDETLRSHEPVVIKSKRRNAVLLSESDWSALVETLHLVSLPGMRQSIQDGMNEQLAECSPELEW